MNTSEAVTTLSQALAVILNILFFIYTVVCLCLRKYELARWSFAMMVIYSIKSDTAGKVEKEEEN